MKSLLLLMGIFYFLPINSMNQSHKKNGKNDFVFIFRPDNPLLIKKVTLLEKESYWLLNQLLERLYQKKQFESRNKIDTEKYKKNELDMQIIAGLLEQKRTKLRSCWKSYAFYSIDDPRTKALLEP